MALGGVDGPGRDERPGKMFVENEVGRRVSRGQQFHWHRLALPLLMRMLPQYVSEPFPNLIHFRPDEIKVAAEVSGSTYFGKVASYLSFIGL